MSHRIFPTTSRTISALTLLACNLFLCSLSPRIYAQVAGATLSGTIRDQSGSTIAGAQVSIKNVATGFSSSVTTNSEGFYSAPNLLPGTYDVSASATGFATQVQSGVVLTVGAQQVLMI